MQMDDLDEFDGSEEGESLQYLIKDPYARKPNTKVTPQQYRIVTIGPEDMLKEGQMI